MRCFGIGGATRGEGKTSMLTKHEERLLRIKTYTLAGLLGGVAMSIAGFSYLWLVARSGPWVRPGVLLTLYVTFGLFSAVLYTAEGLLKLRRLRDHHKSADALKDHSGRH